MHALMIAVMGIAMLSHSALVSVAGAAVLVVASIVCAALSRSRVFLREHVLDLWAMALVLVVFLPHSAVTGHHVVAVPALAMFCVIVVAWAVARGWLALQRRSEWPGVVASGALTGLGLAAMAVFCA